VHISPYGAQTTLPAVIAVYFNHLPCVEYSINRSKWCMFVYQVEPELSS
jgi:hypothetical protein